MRSVIDDLQEIIKRIKEGPACGPRATTHLGPPFDENGVRWCVTCGCYENRAGKQAWTREALVPRRVTP